MKKLFRVDVEKTLYVIADDEGEAERVATRNERDQEADYVHCSEAHEEKHIDSEWKESLPFGGDDKKTCLEWLEELREKAPPYDPPEQGRLAF